jgi:DsbE subfamily thiol:disulfide oxidoreductase
VSRRWWTVVVVAGAVLISLVLWVLPGAPAEPDSGRRTAPALTGTDLDGRRHDLRDLRGSIVLVTTWASWCAPCREEVPVLAAAADRYGHRDVRVLGLNTQDTPERARAFVAAEGVPFPSVVDADGTISVEWGVRGLPETFLVDREGRVAAHRIGAVTTEWVDEVLEPLLAAEEAPS